MKRILLSILTITAFSFKVNAQTYVNTSATGANDGTSWTNAFNDLHDATFNTLSGEIWVAQGSYVPSKTMADVIDSDPSRHTFNIQNNVQVYGGFDGTETLLNQRDAESNLTTLSGDLGGGISVYNIVRIDGNSTATIIDGFTISDGYAVLNNFLWGGGIYLTNSNAIIQNCTFTNNRARFGGAITSHFGTPQILNCKFFNNSTYQYDGGAIYTEGDVIITNCLFDGNTATRRGGAIYSAHGTNIQITNNTFVNNTGSGGTSTIYFVGTNSSTVANVDNCVFYRNTNGTNPSGVAISYFQLVTLSVENCIFEFGAAQISAQTQTNILSGDPIFNDFDNGDFTLSCESPAVNTGDDSGLSIPNVDLNKNTRIFGGTIDMGAYEEVSNQINVYADLTTICLGDSVTLHGTCDGTGYIWDNSVIDGVAFYPASTQTYTCTGTQTGSTQQITITVIDLVDENVSAPTMICTGASANVDISNSILEVNYTLNDGSGNVIDGPILGTGNGLTFNTGAINATTTYSITGQYQPTIPSSTLEFDGLNDEAGTSYIHQSTDNLTVEAWIFPTSTSFGRILSNHLGTGNTLPGNILIDTYNASFPGTSFRVVFGGAGTAWSQHNAANCLTLNAWNHIAVTFNNGNVIQYVNGIQVSTSTSTFTTVPTASAPMHIGEDNTNGGTVDFFEGQMDELRFWSTTRTSTEILDNKNNCLSGTETGLELYYDFESTGTNIIFDMAGSNNATLSSSMDYVNSWKQRHNGFTCSSACSITMTQTATITPSTVDNSTTVVTNLITANQLGASYRWLDCNNGNTVIPSETTQSYTPATNGNYAVEITLNGCTDTSSCVNMTITSINELKSTTMNIAPNPAKDVLNISTLETVEQVTIYSISGSLVKNINQNINQINVEDLTEGMYILVIKTENGITRNRFIKE
jgi:predicted outer membrane repeat protein